MQHSLVFRLEKLISESRLLIPNANLLRRTGLLYKQRLERRCSDLEKAEAEVSIRKFTVGLGDTYCCIFKLMLSSLIYSIQGITFTCKLN
jgi:hypothetical protein